MCGIIGILLRNPGHPFLDNRALDQLAHRGPDGRGIYLDEYISLGHTRLSIIDLTEAGHQPMHYADGRYVITYNGEIYNYLELREELEGLGEKFISRSDTEVLLAAYHIWGEKCVNLFRGMFAFAIWDKREKKLFLARDRCGEKPLIYWQNNNMFLFASEIKGLLPLLPEKPDLEPSVVDMYLHYQYVPEPYTLLKGVQKLPAGHHLIIKVNENDWDPSPVRYWSIEDHFRQLDFPSDEDVIAQRIHDKLEESILLTLRSDVPVGIALSGGIDSGAIAAIAQKYYPQPMHAFSIGYPGHPSYDEREQARVLAKELGMIFHEVELSVEDFIDSFSDLVRIMDEPNADIAAFGHYSVPKAAADMGIKVLLTGIGGDELFWGYPWSVEAIFYNLESFYPRDQSFCRNAIQYYFKKLFRLFYFDNKIHNHQLPCNQLHFYPLDYVCSAFDYKYKIYGSAMRDISIENPFRSTNIGLRNQREIPIAIQRLLFETWLVSNCLNLGDRISMSVGVESRLPFLDYELIELVTAIRRMSPDHAMGSKTRLIRALKGVLPEEVLSRPKQGFQPPVYEWMKKIVEHYYENIRTGHLKRYDFIRIEHLDLLFSKKTGLSNSDLYFLYKLIVLEIWYQKVVN